jgi:1,4-alpha-glucan branching enzyme
MTTRRRPPGGGKEIVNVTFDLPAAVVADEIALCGDFNDWSRNATRLKRNKAGVWRVMLPLRTGHSYRYRFLLDGRHWENDWNADGYVENDYGTEDSVLNT